MYIISQYPVVFFIIMMVTAFLMGSIPFGLIYSLIRGCDIRKVGSGNIGATNVGRQFGFWQGFLPITLLDMAKGVVPILLFRLLISDSTEFPYADFVEVGLGLTAVLGHMFSPWIGFKGGKGVATSGGVFFVLNPVLALLLMGVFLVLFFTIGKKIVGRCSVMTAMTGPLFAYFVVPSTNAVKLLSFIICFAVIYAHSKNIKEWISGDDLKKKQNTKKGA
ncbi:MAG: glycerol-3-phosphate acyltransferase [Brevinemataceae bacterium]